VTEHDEHRAWRLRRRVLPQHTDHAGVMWHGAYLGWLEEARIEALQSAGLAYADLSALGMELPVVKLSIDYRQSLRHGDCIELRSWVLPRRGLKLPWLSRFLRPGGELAAEARVELVLVQRPAVSEGGAMNQPRLPRRLPEVLSQAVGRLQAGPSGIKAAD
jgi:acyl-CoA thioester hydrolase